MKNLKKLLALLLALALLCGVALAESGPDDGNGGETNPPATTEGEGGEAGGGTTGEAGGTTGEGGEGGGTTGEATGSTGTNASSKINQMVTSLERSLNAEIVPEIAINDPGRIVLTVEWIQPQMAFHTVTLNYNILEQIANEDEATQEKNPFVYKDPEGANEFLTDLGIAYDNLDPKEDKEKYDKRKAIVDAMTSEVNEAKSLKTLTYYALADEKDVQFTLSNTSVKSSTGDFRGTLKITAGQSDSEIIDLKGIYGVLTTPTELKEGTKDEYVQKALELKSQARCEEEAAKLKEPTKEEEAKVKGAYIDKESYKYSYKIDKEFYAGFTKVQALNEETGEMEDTGEVAPYYTATPEAEDVIKDLTTTVTFKIQAVKEKAEETKEEEKEPEPSPEPEPENNPEQT